MYIEQDRGNNRVKNSCVTSKTPECPKHHKQRFCKIVCAIVNLLL